MAHHDKDAFLEHLNALMLGVRVDGVAQNRRRRSFVDFEPAGWGLCGASLWISDTVGLFIMGGR